MKKIVILTMLAMMSFIATAQTTSFKFLGIPVDGNKSEFIAALRTKGFVYDAKNDCLHGKFNGLESNIYISENNGKVDRVYVADANVMSEADIIVRYNNLLRQFQKNNAKYYALNEFEEIPSNEDVSYEMLVHNKRYEAAFYYNPLYENEELAEQFAEDVLNELKEQYDVDVLEKADDETVQQMTALMAAKKMIEMTVGQVWFTISEHYGSYFISLYYDNKNNRPNGEDL